MLEAKKLPILLNISGQGSSVLQNTSMNCSLLRPKSEVRGMKSGSAWTRPMISHKMMPKLKMSTFSSYLNPLSISGAIQNGEPTTENRFTLQSKLQILSFVVDLPVYRLRLSLWFFRRLPFPSLGLCRQSRASPKSATTTVRSGFRTRQFWEFKSLWMIDLECR